MYIYRPRRQGMQSFEIILRKYSSTHNDIAEIKYKVRRKKETETRKLIMIFLLVTSEDICSDTNKKKTKSAPFSMLI